MSKPLPTTKEMFAKLIASPSVSSTITSIDQSNSGVIAELASWLNELGFKTEILPLKDDPEKQNLIATLGHDKDASGGLILAGHTDTVPYDQNKWQSDPFQLTEKNERYYGLGTADMKGFFPLALQAIQKINPKDLKSPLTVLATCDEETSMAGAKALIELARPKAPYALIGEPTGLKPVRMHKGIMMDAIKVEGQSGHSSDPNLGINAIEVMNDIIQDFKIWRQELQSQYKNDFFTIPVPTLNFGCIHGGDNPNRICGQCEMQMDLRPLPGMDLTELRQEIDLRLDAIGKRTNAVISREVLFDGVAAFETDAQSQIVTYAESISGNKAESTAFGTEGPYLNQLGAETLIFGPGNIDQAHQPDEYIEIKTFEPLVDIIEQLIRRFCC